MPLLPLSLPLLPQIVHFAQAAKHRHGTGGTNREVGFAGAGRGRGARGGTRVG